MIKHNRFLITLFSVILGMLAGALVLLVAGYSPLEAYGQLFKGVFSNPKYVSWAIIRSTPIILTGISVAFAMRTGLFNIGAEGQFVMGSLGAALAGYFLKLPTGLHALVAILVGALFGAAWGGIAGFLKARRGINEVITTIMLNWIAIYFSNFVMGTRAFVGNHVQVSQSILPSASIRVMGQWKVTEAGRDFLSGIPGATDFFSTHVNWGFAIAVLMGLFGWYMLKNTTKGYQLRAVGLNHQAAEYAGINVKKNILHAMLLAGMFAGIGGATQMLGVSHRVSLMAGAQGFGFDGIAVALIAASNPLACIPAGLLFGALQYGGTSMQSQLRIPFEVINIIIGIIVLFVAMPYLFTLLFDKFGIGRKKKEVQADDTH